MSTMLQVKTARPHPLLASSISAIVQRDFRLRSREEIVEPVIARLGMMLEFQFRDPYRIPSFADDRENPCAPITVIGPISHRRVRLVVRGEVSALAVIFRPSGFHQMFGVPASSFAERGAEGHAVLGPGVSALYERLGNTSHFGERVSLLNDFFLSRVQSQPGNLHHLHGLLRPGSFRSLTELSKQTGLSTRQIERKSLEHFGVSPSMVVRLSRFHRAFRSGFLRGGSWLNIAHNANYYDQMHMIRDFHAFAGLPPAKALAGLKDHHLVHFQRL
jgi:AraC-like DNA-binding protein